MNDYFFDRELVGSLRELRNSGNSFFNASTTSAWLGTSFSSSFLNRARDHARATCSGVGGCPLKEWSFPNSANAFSIGAGVFGRCCRGGGAGTIAGVAGLVCADVVAVVCEATRGADVADIGMGGSDDAGVRSGGGVVACGGACSDFSFSGADFGGTSDGTCICGTGAVAGICEGCSRDGGVATGGTASVFAFTSGDFGGAIGGACIGVMGAGAGDCDVCGRYGDGATGGGTGGGVATADWIPFWAGSVAGRRCTPGGGGGEGVRCGADV